MTKIEQLRKLIREQAKKPLNRPDLSTKEKSFTSWLEKHFQEINSKKIYYNPEQLIDYIAKAKGEIHVSNDYLEKVSNTIRKLKFPKKILKYLYDIYLSGSNLGLAESKVIKENNTKNVYRVKTRS